MATIADLLARLDHDTARLESPATDTAADAHVAGWILLARSTRRAVGHLPLGGRPEQVDVGLRTVLHPLADGPHRLLASTEPVPELARLAFTMGAIADVLADNLRRQQRPEYVGREAAKLEASLLAPVHLAARWSRAGLESQDVPRTQVSIRGQLDDLAAVTEPWALILPANRGSVLEGLRIRTTAAPGLEGAAIAWADEAFRVLSSRYRVTGWAMQAIAANLALISHTAYNRIERDIRAGGLPDGRCDVSKVFATSVTAWRAAAAWPPYLRLGGNVGELRVLTRELQHQLKSDPPATLADTRNLVRLALPVAAAHTTAMDDLVLKHELWIHGPSLGASAGHIPGWEREPWWSHQGLTLMKTAQIAHRALNHASVALAAASGEEPPRSSPLGWPPARPEAVVVPAEARGPSRPRSVPWGPAR